MVVNPKELEKRASAKVQEEVNKLEVMVDKALEQGVMSKGTVYSPVVVSSQILKGVTPYAKERLLAKYRTQGWDVKYYSDLRDGDWYEFKPKKKTQEDYLWRL